MVGLQLIDKDFGKIRLINDLYCVSGTLPYLLNLMIRMKKSAQRHKHCALAVVRPSQKHSPRRRPPSRGRRTAKI